MAGHVDLEAEDRGGRQWVWALEDEQDLARTRREVICHKQVCAQGDCFCH